jgi:NADH-quinone oxidoreductase subunit I
MIRSIQKSFTNLVKKPYTCGYPHTPVAKPKNYRGLIEFNSEHCTWCDRCENVCPPNAIIFKQFEDGHKVYNYNPYLCIYCGDCIRACHKSGEALWQSTEKAPPTTYKNEPNDSWTLWKKESYTGRANYKAKKAEAKLNKLKDTKSSSKP